ncbi:MAG: hypothetical protein ACLRXC_06550 [[Clostridium] leptum]
MKNQDIRQAAKESNIKLWQIADAMNIRDCELSRKLRYELSERKASNPIYHRRTGRGANE